MPRTRAGQHKKAGKPNVVGTMAVFDLGAHRLDEGFDVSIFAPDGQPTPMRVTLASRHSKEFRARKTALDRAWRAAVDPALEMTAEAYSELEILHIVVAQTVAWSGFAVDGAALDCTTDTVRDLFTSPGLGWLFDQVAEEAFRRERFFVRPSSAS